MDQYGKGNNGSQNQQPAPQGNQPQMQQNLGQQPGQVPSQQPQPGKFTVAGLIGNLAMVGAIVMIVTLFIGTFYKSSGGAYAYHDVVKGYKLIFNSDALLGTLLLICPALVLIAHYIKGLKQYEGLIQLVMPLICLILVFVLKGQLGDAVGDETGGQMGLAMGGILYLLGTIICIVGAAAKFFGIDLNQKLNEVTKK